MHPTLLKTLLNTPFPAPEAKVAAPVDPKEAARTLWTAIDLNQPEVARAALDAGARPTSRRGGEPAIWRAVASGQWEIASVLRERGADVSARTQAGLSIYAAIAERDDPTEAERLKAWGVDPREARPDEFLERQGAPALLQWWIEQDTRNKVIRRGSEPTELIRWALVGLRGTPELRRHFNEAWGLDESRPELFAEVFNAYRGLHERVWDHLASKDDPELARRALASGWGMDANEDPCWMMARAGAWKTLDWFVQVPALKAQMIERGRWEPMSTWWFVCRRGVPAMERMLALEMDLEQRDGKGRNLAHALLMDGGVKRAGVQWLIRKAPHLASSPDHEGHPPTSLVRDPEMKADIEAMALAATTAQGMDSKKAGPRL